MRAGRALQAWLLGATLLGPLAACASSDAAAKYDRRDPEATQIQGYRGSPRHEVAAEYDEGFDGDSDDVDLLMESEAGGGTFESRPSTAPSGAPAPVGGVFRLEPELEPAADQVAQAEPVTPTPEAPPPSNVAAPTRRLVIYTGSVGVLVADVEGAQARFLAWITEQGGWMQSQSGGTVTVRVPAERFDEAVEHVKAYGPIFQRQIEAADVTRQVFELQLRLENAERARARLLELLAKADKVEDILEIEAEITRLTAEIEVMKGQLRTLTEQIAFSTLTVEFRSTAPEVTPYAGRQPSRFHWINQVGAERAQSWF